MEMDFSQGYNTGINDKVALVSGGASGIGKACAKLLSAAGTKVAILDIDVERGKEVAKEIKDQGGTAFFLKCDVGDDTSCKRGIEQAEEKFGSIDILVTDWVPLTTAGWWTVAIVADIVAVFAIVQFYALRRN